MPSAQDPLVGEHIKKGAIPMKMKFMTMGVFILLSSLMLAIGFLPAAESYSAASPKLNSKKQYLYLDKKGSNTYDFNVVNNQKDWSCEWTSSNKAVAAVNKSSGLATAVGIGSAKITATIKDKSRKVIYRLSATVIVKDNIVSLAIKNKPKGNKLTVGEEYAFKTSFKTASGSEIKTTSILKWTVDQKGAEITDEGIFKASEPGEYTITVNAFQSEDKYKLWRSDEKANAGYQLAFSIYKVTVEAAADGKVVPVNTYKLTDGVAYVNNLAEFKGALADEAVEEIEFAQSFEISEDITVTKKLFIIEQEVINKGVLTIKAEITLGGSIFENKGSIIVSAAGNLGVYMTDFNNQSEVTVEVDGLLIMDRGGRFNNDGILVNNGLITITSDGGSFNNNPAGTIENNGAIDCTGYYQNVGTYKGTGTEPVGL
jgi:hypothetical protein